MSTEIDILIVFADADNETSVEGSPGWISQFKKFLEFILAQVLDEKPKVLLKGEFDSLTSPRLNNVGVLVPVLSKNFIASAQCLENVQAFRGAADMNSNRIFKVLKAPILLQEQPDFLRPLLAYEMFQLDADSGELREYKNYFSTEAERQYWMELVDLSYDIANALHLLKHGRPAGSVKDLKPKIVYLAETGHDLSVERNIIMRELQRHGYTILPGQTLWGNTVEIEQMVRKDLETCTMAIHLIGNTYGEIPDGGTSSVVDIQNKIASEKSQEARKRNESFSRLIWITPNLAHANERQKRFIETIKRDVEGQEGDEILETPLEDFKNIIREELLEAQERKAVKDTGGRAIYLVHDKEDDQDVRPYIELIERSGFRVLMPAFGGELLEQRQKHIENLRAFDAAIIYKGKVNEQWVRIKASDIMKAPGFGRKKPIVAKAILAAPGDIANRDAFKMQDFRLIEGDSQYFVESLKLFLSEFRV